MSMENKPKINNSVDGTSLCLKSYGKFGSIAKVTLAEVDGANEIYAVAQAKD